MVTGYFNVRVFMGAFLFSDFINYGNEANVQNFTPPGLGHTWGRLGYAGKRVGKKERVRFSYIPALGGRHHAEGLEYSSFHLHNIFIWGKFDLH